MLPAIIDIFLPLCELVSDRQQQIDGFKLWANTSHMVTLQPDLVGVLL
jgi:hypothetical protein